MIQRLSSDVLARYDLSKALAALANTDAYKVSTNKVAVIALEQRLRAYNTWEQEQLDFADYAPSGHSVARYEQAIKELEAIGKEAGQLAGKLTFANWAPELRAVLQRIKTAAAEDLKALAPKLKRASASAQLDAYDLLKSGITESAFTKAYDAGLLEIRPGKWWSSHRFQPPNAELWLYIGGTPWAIAHLKYTPGKAPTGANRSMAHLKNLPNTQHVDVALANQGDIALALQAVVDRHASSAELVKIGDYKMT